MFDYIVMQRPKGKNKLVSVMQNKKGQPAFF